MKIHRYQLSDNLFNYFFTKDKNNCLSVEYNKRFDYGKHDPSGCSELEVKIHYKNSWVLSDKHEEISLKDVPEAVQDVLSYLVKSK